MKVIRAQSSCFKKNADDDDAKDRRKEHPFSGFHRSLMSRRALDTLNLSPTNERTNGHTASSGQSCFVIHHQAIHF
jgi:hypothetical protein